MTDEEKEMSTWHIDKRVSISHILTTLLIAVSIFWWAGKTETRLALLEQNIAVIQTQATEADKRYTAIFGDIRDSLRRIEDKLDEKADKQK